MRDKKLLIFTKANMTRQRGRLINVFQRDDDSIPEQVGKRGFARVAVAAFVAQLDVTVEELSDIKTAVSEAVTNSIVHGYENVKGYITVECRMKMIRYI